MTKFREWYLKYDGEITWFLIGSMLTTASDSFGRGDLLGCVAGLILAYINYYFWKRN
jgi:hypothetical protein